MCEMGKASFFQKKMYFLLHFFTVQSKGEGPAITGSSTDHLSCDGWQSLSFSPRGTAACSSQHTARSALARQRLWQPSHICTAAGRKQQSFPSPCSSLQHPLGISFRFLVTDPIRAMGKPGAAVGSGSFALDPPICHYWSVCTLGRKTSKNNCFLLVL